MKKAAKSDPLVLLMKMARKDAEFFHDLVFAPKKALSKVKSLDRTTKARLLKVRPGTVMGALLPHAAPCGNDQTCSGSTCDNTCAESCGGMTCGGGSCQSTCENSCDDTISPPSMGRRRADLDSVRWARVSTRAKTTRSRVQSRKKTPRRRRPQR
jgi:hypothetical protein